MPVTDNSTANADGLANHLETTLTAGKDFSLPALDLESPAFDFPVEAGNTLYSEVSKLTESDLTTRELHGTGLFDGLMVALSNHLEKEYSSNRLTGKEYAEVYVQLTTTALGSAVSYLLGRDQAYWQAQLAQKQARAAEVAVVTARMQSEQARAELVVARSKVDLVAIEYALSKIKLANEDIQYALGEAQLAGVNATTQAQLYQNANTLPAQLASIQKQTAIADYQLTYLMPKELDKATKAIELTTSQISHTTAQKDQVLYQTASVLVAQTNNLAADTATKNYQVASVLPAQVAGINADTAGKVYSNQYLLPANLTSVLENNEANRAKTLDTRTDGTVVKGMIGKQNALYDQQIASYKRADEAKVAKMFLDTWITQKSMDEGLVAPTSLTDSNINTVMSKIRTNLALT